MITQEQLAQAMLDLKLSQEAMGLRLEASQEKSEKSLTAMGLRLEASQEKSEKSLKAMGLRLEASQEKSDRRLDKLGKLVGNIANNQGDIAEEFFYNSLKAKPSLGGINYDFIEPNAHRSKNNIEDEYDILLVNGNDIAIIETKYKAHISDIEKLINKKYTNFKKLYPEYKDY
nr:hypothetical protein [Colwellia sp.]